MAAMMPGFRPLRHQDSDLSLLSSMFEARNSLLMDRASSQLHFAPDVCKRSSFASDCVLQLLEATVADSFHSTASGNHSVDRLFAALDQFNGFNVTD